MKLILCPTCCDVVVLAQRRRACRCGLVAGKYKADGWHAWVTGDPLVLGINSNDLRRVVMQKRIDGSTAAGPLDAWVMQDDAKRVERR